MRYLPTVTEVIGPWVDWSKIPPGTLQAAQERGTAVHELCANYARGLWSPVPEEYAGYFESFLYWFNSSVMEVILVEERLFAQGAGFCGQIDLLIESKNGEAQLIDLKTPLALSKSWRVQLAAYQELCEKNGHHPDRIGSLRLNKEGGIPRMDWFEGGSADLNIFMSALNCWRYFKQ